MRTVAAALARVCCKELFVGVNERCNVPARNVLDGRARRLLREVLMPLGHSGTASLLLHNQVEHSWAR